MILLVALANAGSVGGFSTPGADPAHAAALQAAAMLDGERTHAQASLLLSTRWRSLGLDVDVVGLAGSGISGWSDAGVGSIRVGVRAFTGRPGFRHAIGLDFRTGWEEPRVGFWVTRSADALAVYLPRLTWDFTVGPAGAPLSLRVSLGASATGFADPDTRTLLGTGVSVAKLVPFGERWQALLEAELLADDTPLSVRGGARWHPTEHWEVDALVSVPVVLFLAHPVFVPAVQLRGVL